MAAPDPMIAAEGLSLLRQGRTVLRGVNFAVARGEFVAIIGASGAGKTSLLRCINRLIGDYTGTIRMDGGDTAGIALSALRRRMGYVLQNIGLFPHLTIGENISLPGRIGGRDPDPTRIAELLGKMALPTDMAARNAAQLSGGQAQRVAIARALYLRPALMLMDEPFGALDPSTRVALGRAYRGWHDEAGLTTIMVTHDVAEALALADRVMVVDDGGIAAFAPPAELVESDGAAIRALIDPPLEQARRLLALRDGAR